MTPGTVTAPVIDEVTLVKLAREVAMDIHDLDVILKNLNVSDAQWQAIKTNPRFVRYLETAVADWTSAANVHDRVKVKAAAVIEEWLPEAHTRLHDRAETLSAKTELGKLVAKLAGMGLERAGIGVGDGERISININLGSESVKIEKQITPRVIEGEVEE